MASFEQTVGQGEKTMKYARIYFLLTLFIVSIMSMSQAKTLLEELKTTVGVRVDLGAWQHRAEGLAKWTDSGLYNQGFVPQVSFDNIRHFNLSVHLALRGMRIGYSFFGSDILGFIHPPEYKAVFKDQYGEKIRITGGYLKNKNYEIDYLYKKKLGVFLHWQSYYYELSPTDSYNLDMHPLGQYTTIYCFSKGYSFGLLGKPILAKKIQLSWAVGASPRLSGYYEYTGTGQHRQQIEFSEYFAELQIGYVSECGLVPSIGFLYKKRSTKDHLIQDTFKNLIISMEYSF
jgi:hypothetical protein